MEFLAIFQNDTIGLEECGVMILKIFSKEHPDSQGPLYVL